MHTKSLRRRPARRRLSIVQSRRNAPAQPCRQLSHPSIAPTLATLRLHVLSYLADLETRLAQLESPISADSLVAKGESTMEEARMWARDGLEMLRSIREDVCSHLPDLNVAEDFVRSHVPDLPDFHLPDVRSRLDDVRSVISDIDFHRPLQYVPTLDNSLHSLQEHLATMECYFESLEPSSTLSTLLDNVLSSELIADLSSELREGEDRLEKAAMEVARAMQRSLNGSRLIHYVDLPEQWRNNPFVKSGYRFIPLSDWPRLLFSVFTLHNETVNIYTHLIPFIIWFFALLKLPPFDSFAISPEPAVVTFTAFALLCLFTSSVWHTMAGCGHFHGMDLCARIDYVGIGWLISASVGSIVHYGFQCQPMTSNFFLALCFATGMAGSILPFMDWFNKVEYKMYRIAFFLSLAFTSLAPLAELSRQHSFSRMLEFIGPVIPSLSAYVVGLVFYATHFPECYLTSRWPTFHWLDWLGGGSHAIWHVCIVLAISQFKDGLGEMLQGIDVGCAVA